MHENYKWNGLVFIEKPKGFHQLLHELLHELLHQTLHQLQACLVEVWQFLFFYFINFILYFINDYSSSTKYTVLFINFVLPNFRIRKCFNFQSCRYSSLLYNPQLEWAQSDIRWQSYGKNTKVAQNWKFWLHFVTCLVNFYFRHFLLRILPF